MAGINRVRLCVFAYRFLGLILIIKRDGQDIPDGVFKCSIYHVSDRVRAQVLDFTYISGRADVAKEIERFNVRRRITATVSMRFQQRYSALIRRAGVCSCIRYLVYLPFRVKVERLAEDVTYLYAITVNDDGEVRGDGALVAAGAVIAHGSVASTRFWIKRSSRVLSGFFFTWAPYDQRDQRVSPLIILARLKEAIDAS